MSAEMPGWECPKIELEEEGLDPIQALFAWLEGKKIYAKKDK